MPKSSIDITWVQKNFPDLTDLDYLNQGGYKFVLSAIHPMEGAIVLKIINPSQPLQEVEREISAVRTIQSPVVPEIKAYGTIDSPIGDCVWIREQRIQGHTIREALAAGPMLALEVVKMGVQILGALLLAEQNQIVHRDIKPDNIMRDKDGNYWLLDFGISRHLTMDSLTATNLPFGKMTPGYAPPEQMFNQKQAITSSADLFALGVTMYECITGNNPFRSGARDFAEMMRRVEKNSLPRLTTGLKQDDSFADLIATLTQRRVDHRPESIAEALTWLQEIYDSEIEDEAA